MSLSLVPGEPTEQDKPGARAAQRVPPATARRREDPTLCRQLGIIGEMLTTMDTLTTAGQRHNMDRIVAFIREKADHASLPLGRRNRAVLAELLDRLTQEAHRRSPSVAGFTRTAESLLSLLRLLA